MEYFISPLLLPFRVRRRVQFQFLAVLLALGSFVFRYRASDPSLISSLAASSFVLARRRATPKLTRFIFVCRVCCLALHCRIVCCSAFLSWDRL